MCEAPNILKLKLHLSLFSSNDIFVQPVDCFLVFHQKRIVLSDRFTGAQNNECFTEKQILFLFSGFNSQNHHLPDQPQHQIKESETDTYDRIRIKKPKYKASTLPNDNPADANIRRDPGSNRCGETVRLLL